MFYPVFILMHSTFLVYYLMFRGFATIWESVFAMNVIVTSIKLSSLVLRVKIARYEQLRLLCFCNSNVTSPFHRQ